MLAIGWYIIFISSRLQNAYGGFFSCLFVTGLNNFSPVKTENTCFSRIYFLYAAI